MIELLINLFAFSILITLFGGVILGIVAFFQNRGLRRRILELEEREASPEHSAFEAAPESSEPEPAEEQKEKEVER